jgi:hypothetical protein
VNFSERRLAEVQLRGISLPRTSVNRRNLTVVVPWHILPSRKDERGETAVVDTFLTLVIALGGIATGIGAIWAAVAARRQAQLTERSLAQTERSLSEQNERLRLNLEVDLLDRMLDRFNSQHFRGRRSAVAKYFLDNAFVDDRMVEVERLNEAAIDVCDFFEFLAYLQKMDALSTESVWNAYAVDVRLHWPLCKPGIERMREE